MFYWYLPGEKAQAEKLFAEFAPTLDFFESTIGPYPFADEKVGVVETPHQGMEHQTINAYDNKYKKLYGRWRSGDGVYTAMMLKLREGVQAKSPLVTGEPQTADDVYAKQPGRGTDIYDKGAWVLHTLRFLIGDKAFFDAVKLTVYGALDSHPSNFKPVFRTTLQLHRQREAAPRAAICNGSSTRICTRPRCRSWNEKTEGHMLTLTWKAPGEQTRSAADRGAGRRCGAFHRRRCPGGVRDAGDPDRDARDRRSDEPGAEAIGRYRCVSSLARGTEGRTEVRGRNPTYKPPRRRPGPSWRGLSNGTMRAVKIVSQLGPGLRRGGSAFAAVSLALLAAAPLPKKGEPAITEQTQKSGGVRPPEQLAVRFDTADLAFEVLPDKERLNGVATLGFTAKAPLTRLLIDLDRNLPVTAIAIDGVALPSTAWSNPDGQLAITLPHAVATGGEVSARITYGGTPHVAVRAPWDDGMVWSKTPDGRTWFATTAEGYGCDLFWPCLDFPTGEPGVVTIHITVPKGLKAPSNGKLLGVDTLPGGRTRWNWRVKHPNTYAIALNVGPYEQISGSYKSRFGNTIPIYYWYLPGEKAQAEELFAEFAPTLDFFETMIGPYPFGDEKVGVVETPHMGMEHQTINASRQPLRQVGGRVRLAVPARVRPRMVRQPADRCELGRLLAARRLWHLHAAAVRPVARRRGALCGDAGQRADQDREQGPDRPRTPDYRGRGLRADQGRARARHLLQGVVDAPQLALSARRQGLFCGDAARRLRAHRSPAREFQPTLRLDRRI